MSEQQAGYEAGIIQGMALALAAISIAKEYGRDPLEQLRTMSVQNRFEKAHARFERIREEMSAVRSEAINSGEIDT